MRLLLLLLIMTTIPAQSFAHQSSSSYLVLNFSDTPYTAQWDIALRDLETAIGLDRDGDSKITWGELKYNHEKINQYALSRLALSRANTLCDIRPTENLVNNHNDGAYAVIRFAINCGINHGNIKIAYRLFHDLDSRHRGLLKTIHHQSTQLSVLTATSNEFIITTSAPDVFTLVMSFLRQGITHILGGLDHLLFLILLLLPVVLQRKANQWHANDSFSQTMIETLKIVTAFTVAHALTLCLSVFEVIFIPPRLVESLIAVSVMIAACNNIYPFITKHRWRFAFAFGLVHGFGFANTLQGLDLSIPDRVITLLSFNLGVEIAQLIIASVFLPLAYQLRTYRVYQHGILPYGAAIVFIIATIWLIERGLDLKINFM